MCRLLMIVVVLGDVVKNPFTILEDKSKNTRTMIMMENVVVVIVIVVAVDAVVDVMMMTCRSDLRRLDDDGDDNDHTSDTKIL
jgi:hypothetical protein